MKFRALIADLSFCVIGIYIGEKKKIHLYSLNEFRIRYSFSVCICGQVNK